MNGPDLARLAHLARVLREAEPRFILPARGQLLTFRLTPEQTLVLRALAAEGGVPPAKAAKMLMDAALTSDRLLVHKAFGIEGKVLPPGTKPW